MIYMPGVASETQLMHFDMAGIALSSGAACSSGKVETSHVLLAMGVSAQFAKCAIRVSPGIDNNMQDAEKFINAWKALYERAGAKKVA
jgi:cysteine desulfurase